MVGMLVGWVGGWLDGWVAMLPALACQLAVSEMAHSRCVEILIILFLFGVYSFIVSVPFLDGLGFQAPIREWAALALLDLTAKILQQPHSPETGVEKQIQVKA
jgi:hypothetical protein